jgi:hypothetical protein
MSFVQEKNMSVVLLDIAIAQPTRTMQNNSGLPSTIPDVMDYSETPPQHSRRKGCRCCLNTSSIVSYSLLKEKIPACQ